MQVNQPHRNLNRSQSRSTVSAKDISSVKNQPCSGALSNLRHRLTLILTGSFPRQLLRCLVVAMSLSIFSTPLLAEKINLNMADASTLEEIPGIGPDKSRKIVLERERVGKFTEIEQLLAVPGIGEKTLQSLKQYGSLGDDAVAISEQTNDNTPGE